MFTKKRLLFTFAILTFLTFISPAVSRAVNISNTWMLPQEDFPVFYRYFRDRISWYEADAVCQFHHANLVTADTSSQFDAIRAYLKELDVTENVWIGLSKKSPNSEFTWSDSRILSGEGHWKEMLPVTGEPLCVTVDPSADFLWNPYSCSGPESASFICELPVPSWALGQRGCLLTELPSLTVLYIPEQMALELTSDCGMDGTKRITCKGNADREDILKQLTCTITNEDDFEDRLSTTISSDIKTASDVTETTTENAPLQKTTRSSGWTVNSEEGYEMSTRHRRETEDTLSPSAATIAYRKLDSAKPSSSLPMAFNDETEVTTTNLESTMMFASAPTSYDTQADKPNSKQKTQKKSANSKPVVSEDSSTISGGKVTDALSDDLAEFPSAINQGQLFSIIENGTMFDIIELNDTNIEEASPSKAPLITTTKKNQPQIQGEEEATTGVPTTTTLQPNKTFFTTVGYFKEPPPDSVPVTNKSQKKYNKQPKTKYYKKSDPKNINYQSEKDQREMKEAKYNYKNDEEAEIDKDLTKEVEMFPIIASGGPFVKLNRTHRKELPVIIDENEDIFGLNVENLMAANPVVEGNKLGMTEHQKDVEVTFKKKEDANSSDVFIVTTKFLDEQLGKHKLGRNQSTTIFSEPLSNNATANLKTHNETSAEKIEIVGNSSPSTEINDFKLTTPLLIDPNLNELNKNLSQNNESEEVTRVSQPIKTEGVRNTAWVEEGVLSKSLLGEIETITDDVIENNTSDVEIATSEPLNLEPNTPDRLKRRRKLTNPQRRSFYPYFFSRVLG